VGAKEEKKAFLLFENPQRVTEALRSWQRIP